MFLVRFPSSPASPANKRCRDIGIFARSTSRSLNFPLSACRPRSIVRTRGCRNGVSHHLYPRRRDSLVARLRLSDRTYAINRTVHRCSTRWFASLRGVLANTDPGDPGTVLMRPTVPPRTCHTCTHVRRSGRSERMSERTRSAFCRSNWAVMCCASVQLPPSDTFWKLSTAARTDCSVAAPICWL